MKATGYKLEDIQEMDIRLYNAWHSYLDRNPPVDEVLPTQFAVLSQMINKFMGGNAELHHFGKWLELTDSEKQAIQEREKQQMIEARKREALEAIGKMNGRGT